MYLLDKPYSVWFYKNQKKLLLLPYFQRTSGVTAARFFEAGCKGKSLYLFNQFYFEKSFKILSEKRGEKSVCSKSFRFLTDGKNTTLIVNCETFLGDFLFTSGAC